MAVFASAYSLPANAAQDKDPELPEPNLSQLTVSQQLQTWSANTEEALAQRFGLLESLATQCKSCQTALLDAQESAEGRLEFLGGVWQPGEASQRESAVPPFTPSGSATFGALSAKAELAALAEWEMSDSPDSIAEPSTVPWNHVVALAAPLAERIVSSALLLKEFTEDPRKELKALAEAPVPDYLVPTLTAPQASDQEQGSNPSDADENDADPALEGLERPDPGEFAVAFDCIAATVLFEGTDKALSYAQSLRDRVHWLAARGIVERLPARCVLPEYTDEELGVQLLQADLALMTSGQVVVREQAAQWLWEDSLSLVEKGWVKSSDLQLVTVLGPWGNDQVEDDDG